MKHTTHKRTLLKTDTLFPLTNKPDWYLNFSARLMKNASIKPLQPNRKTISL